MLLSSASRDCARLLAEAEKLRRQAQVNLAPPDADVKRDVLRLVDVDPLQSCNGLSTIAQADNLFKRVVRDGGLFVRRDELSNRVAGLRGGVRGAASYGSRPYCKRRFGLLMISLYTHKTSSCSRSKAGIVERRDCSWSRSSSRHPHSSREEDPSSSLGWPSREADPSFSLGWPSRSSQPLAAASSWSKRSQTR